MIAIDFGGLDAVLLQPEIGNGNEDDDENENENDDEYERLKAAEQRLIATGSLVNVAEQRLKDTQSQGDDSPATPLRLTSSEAASHDKYEN